MTSYTIIATPDKGEPDPILLKVGEDQCLQLEQTLLQMLIIADNVVDGETVKTPRWYPHALKLLGYIGLHNEARDMRDQADLATLTHEEIKDLIDTETADFVPFWEDDFDPDVSMYDADKSALDLIDIAELHNELLIEVDDSDDIEEGDWMEVDDSDD